jgi:hypothetical protein
VTDLAALEVAVDRAAEELGGLDGLVTAAGLVRPGGIATPTRRTGGRCSRSTSSGAAHGHGPPSPPRRCRSRRRRDALVDVGPAPRSTEMGVYAATKAGGARAVGGAAPRAAARPRSGSPWSHRARRHAASSPARTTRSRPARETAPAKGPVGGRRRGPDRRGPGRPAERRARRGGAALARPALTRRVARGPGRPDERGAAVHPSGHAGRNPPDPAAARRPAGPRGDAP